jgi:hypothetical protein
MRKLIFLLLLLPFLANAQTERFNDFKATIRLSAKGDVKVTERIRATANGDQIKRGITRPLRANAYYFEKPCPEPYLTT